MDGLSMDGFSIKLFDREELVNGVDNKGQIGCVGGYHGVVVQWPSLCG